MRRTVLLLSCAGLLAVPAAASAQAVAPDDGPVAQRSAEPLTVRGFTVSPRAVVAGGAPAKVLFRLDGGRGPVSVRVDLVRAGTGRVAARLAGGERTPGRLVTQRWPVDVPAGRYVARLHATDVTGQVLTRFRGRSGRAPLTVTARRGRRPAVASAPGASPVPTPAPTPAPTATPAPAPVATPAPTTGGHFPVRGAWSYGGADARFGAGRPGHVHQGQDVVAAQGTPVVAPGAATVSERKVQASGAGHYLVLRSDAGPDWVFMHLVAGSELVAKGDRVAAGQQIAQVGSTGASSGPHLHFELWPDGWYAPGSSPVDPLPQLKRWAAG